MFGHRPKPKLVLKPRPVPLISSVPGLYPEHIGIIARDPCTDYTRRSLEYRQHHQVLSLEKQQKLLSDIEDERREAKYLTHTEHKRFARKLGEKVNKKMNEYEENIEKRRLALTDKLFVEERELTKEVVTTLQSNIREKDKLEKLAKTKAEKAEADRAFVAEKRMQQYVARCEEMRPKIAQERCIEAAEAQKIQRQENAAKLQSEQEMEQFWHGLMLKYCEALDEREEQEKLKKLKQINEFKFYSDLQAKEKVAKEQQLHREMMEEKERLANLKKEIEEEERVFKERKEKKRRDAKQMFMTEMKQRNEFLTDIANREREIQRAYDKLVDEEIERENAKERAKVSTALEDNMKFKKYLEDMKKQEMEEDAKMQQIISTNLNEIQRKDDEERCRDITQRKLLLQSVLSGRAQQVEEKRKLAEKLKKEKEIEGCLIQATIDKNLELEKEYQRVYNASAKKYQDDLKQQIAYNKVLEERERDNLKKILQLAKEEDDKYNTIVANVLSGNVKVSETHGFRRVIENEKCPCLKPNY